MNKDIEEVTEIATKYLQHSAGYLYVRVIQIVSDEIKKEWKVAVNVGSFVDKVKTITINDINGKVAGFE